jgi:hypothetical protein
VALAAEGLEPLSVYQGNMACVRSQGGMIIACDRHHMHWATDHRPEGWYSPDTLQMIEALSTMAPPDYGDASGGEWHPVPVQFWTPLEVPDHSEQVRVGGIKIPAWQWKQATDDAPDLAALWHRTEAGRLAIQGQHALGHFLISGVPDK